jgi:hypothetical protein
MEWWSMSHLLADLSQLHRHTKHLIIPKTFTSTLAERAEISEKTGLAANEQSFPISDPCLTSKLSAFKQWPERYVCR